MIFLKPHILWALFAIAIPILIHLFNFKRYRKVYFSNLHMLKEVKLQSKRQSQLRQWLVLLSRILIIMVLVMAFAGPLIPGDTDPSAEQEERFVSLFVDNSFSMQGDGENSSLLEEARTKAHTIVSGYDATDQFLLLTNDLRTEHNRLYNQADMLELIDDISISPASKPLSEILDFQSTFFEQNEEVYKHTYILSDFQKTQSDFLALQEDSLNKLLLLPLITGSKDNVYIDSVWFEQPILKVQEVLNLNVRLVSKASGDIDKLPLNLFINGLRKGIAQSELKAGVKTTVQIPFQLDETGLYKAYVELDDYPITYDDRYYFTFELSAYSQVLDIRGESASAATGNFYQLDSMFRYQAISSKAVDYAAFADKDLIVLNNLEEVSTGLQTALNDFVRKGGNLLIIPSKNAELQSYNELFDALELSRYSSLDTAGQRITKVDFDNEIYRVAFDKDESHNDNYDFPMIRNAWKTERATASTLPLLHLANGQAYLESKQVEEGSVYRLNNNLGTESGSFHQHALIVPTLLNIASFKASDLILQYGMDQQKINLKQAPLLGSEEVYTLRNTEKDFSFIPGIRRMNNTIELQLYHRIKEAGVYDLFQQEEKTDNLAFNYNRKESDLSYYESDEIEDILRETNVNYQLINSSNSLLLQEIQQNNEGRLLWKLFVILALVFLLFEVLLLRFFKA